MTSEDQYEAVFGADYRFIRGLSEFVLATYQGNMPALPYIVPVQGGENTEWD